MLRLLLAAIVILTYSGALSADVLGWRIGANAWLQDYDADPQLDLSSSMAGDSLDVDDEVGYNLYLAFEHPVPLLPNVLLQHSSIDSSEQDDSVELTHTDLTLYYELLDNWINLDVGVTGRVFNGALEISLEDIDFEDKDDIDYLMPAVYGQLRFDLPFSGLSMGAEGNWGRWDDDEVLDVKLNLAYEFTFGLGMEGGYRVFEFDYDDGAATADITVEGFYGGIFWDF